MVHRLEVLGDLSVEPAGLDCVDSGRRPADDVAGNGKNITCGHDCVEAKVVVTLVSCWERSSGVPAAGPWVI